MIKIIIADCHQIIREGLKMILKKESDFKFVAEAQDGSEVLQKVLNNSCDILLLDMDMPGKRGIELIIDIKKLKPQVHILALSIHPEDKSAVRMLKSGASGYVCKDSAKTELIIAIRKIMTHGRYLSAKMVEHLVFEIIPPRGSLPHEQLSNREMETMYLLVSGKSVKDIALELDLSISTVFTYRGRIFEKLAIKTNVELMHYAINYDLVELKSMAN